MHKKIPYFVLYIAFFCIGILFFNACDDSLEIKEKINLKVKEKLDDFRWRKLKKCRDKALEDAETFVDSIITEITKNAVYKDLDFPEKPVRDTANSEYNINLDSFDIKKVIDSLEISDPAKPNDRDTVRHLKQNKTNENI